MKLLVEGHPYPFESIKELFPNVDELDVVDGVASVNYVGYYYHAKNGEGNEQGKRSSYKSGYCNDIPSDSGD